MYLFIYRTFSRGYNIDLQYIINSLDYKLEVGDSAYILAPKPNSPRVASGEHPDGLGPFLRCYYTGPVTPQEWSNKWPFTCNNVDK